MVFLFRSGTYVVSDRPANQALSAFIVTLTIGQSLRFREKIYLILKATRQHARNLASFAVIYKSSMLLLRMLNPTRPGKEGRYDTFLAGLLGGYTVFGRGRQGSVNQQVVTSVTSMLLRIDSPFRPPHLTDTTLL
jgi:Tim17/Tim22/Tim23/Pmp24 family